MDYKWKSMKISVVWQIMTLDAFCGSLHKRSGIENDVGLYTRYTPSKET